MISIKLIGGLGNQMFQYALGRHLAYIHNTLLCLDISEYEQYPNRKYSLDCFNIIAQINTSKPARYFSQERYWIEKYVLKHFPILFRLKNPNYYVFTERHFHYDPQVLKLPDKVYLNGYWQTEKYFQGIEKIIKKEFTLKKIRPELSLLIHKLRKSNSISIHIRRGDYVSEKIVNEYHGLCSPDYYNEAVKIMIQKIKSPNFYIFSDDITWVENNFHLKYPVTYIGRKYSLKDYEEMYLMSQCQHNIVANSSFSWWAAWLNTNKNKVIIAPKRWFRNNTLNQKDLLPQKWLKI